MFDRFERLIAPFPAEEPTQPPTSLYAFCRHYTQGCEKWLLLMALLSGFIAIIEAVLFGFLGQLVDWLGTVEHTALLAEHGWTLLGMGLLVLPGLPLIVGLHSLLIHQTLLGNYPMVIRWQAHRYLLDQSLEFYQDDYAGRIATKVLQTALAVRESVMKLLDVMLYVTVFFISMMVVVSQSDWRLTLPLGLWLIGYIIILSYFVPRLRAISARQADARSVMTGRLVDSYTNISTVKLFSHAKRESSYAREGMQGFLDTVHPQMRLVTWLVVTVWSLNSLLLFSISALSIGLWSLGTVGTGVIAVAIGLALRLNGMSQWIMWEISALFENIGTVQDGISTLSRPREVLDAPDAKPLHVRQGHIRFEHVRFHYGKDSGVFDDLCLDIAPGEKVGLVGRSGAGKSTLVNLLLRFHDVEDGRILIDEQDIRRVSQESLRANIGMVTQDTSLLHRSVRENILYGRPDASEGAMLDAARKAEALDFIQTLTDPKGQQGFAAQVGERGVKLSGGQRQRIAIARVMLKDAPILVLDEATSALDSEVEAAIQHSLSRLMRGKTVIAIAHRLSTIAALDRLVVLDEGRIIEQGTHAELVRGNGLYAQLWAHQSGGFLGLN